MLVAALIILEIIIVAVLIYVFRKIMTQNVVLATKQLEERNQDYIKKEMEVNRRLNESQAQSEAILKKAQEEVVSLKEQILKAAEAERDKIINEARAQAAGIVQQAEKTRKSLLAELEERIAKEAVDKACELIQNTVPEQFREMHAHWVEDLLAQGFSRLEHLGIPTDIQEIKLVSAFELSEQQRKNILKKIKEVLGRDNFKLKEKVDSKIVAGIIITIGSLVLDGSFRNKIQEQAKSAKQQSGS